MTKDEAARLVDRMLGSYPSVNLYDPEVFIAGMVVLLKGYPHWAGESAVRKAIGSDECKFSPPTQGILRPLLEAEVKVYRYAEEWNQRAESSLLALAAPRRETEEERKAASESILKKHGFRRAEASRGEQLAAKAASLEAVRKANALFHSQMRGGSISGGIPITPALQAIVKGQNATREDDPDPPETIGAGTGDWQKLRAPPMGGQP
jgi:hypothetical protein